jgi:hypothetical protein
MARDRPAGRHPAAQVIIAFLLACGEAEAPEPVVEAAPQGPVAGALVTNDQFAAWLETNPQYKREQAIHNGVADEDYLQRWPDGKPPAGKGAGPVGGVSFHIASEYCADDGGVAKLDQPPPMAEVDGMIFEMRTAADGTAVFVSTTANVPTDSVTTSPYATFRCSR